MKKKRIFAFLAALTVLIVFCCGAFVSSASVFYTDGRVVHNPGNTRKYMQLDDYNYAWIDDVVLRDGSASVTALIPHPVTDYPYSHTCDEFVRECNDYTSLFYVTDSAIEDTFLTSLKQLYYSLVAMGAVKEDYQTMRAYNESRGIVYPYVDSQFTQMYTAIVYICLNNDLSKKLLNQEIYIPRGTTVEGAVVTYLSAICGMNVSSTVSTVAGFSAVFAEDYVIEDSQVPISKDPSEEEVFYWTKVLAANERGYSVPMTTPYASVTQEQSEYVTYAYYASILTTKYEVMIDPMELKAACLSGENNAVAKLVLKSMLDDVSVSYSSSESMESLFEKAKAEGFFDLEEDFYSDIYDYEVTVGLECEEIWITPFLVASQIVDANVDNVKTFVNSNPVKNISTTGIKLNSTTDTVFSVKIVYNDGTRHDTADYTFTVKKSADGPSTVGGVNIDIENPINSVVDNLGGFISGYYYSPTNPVSSYDGNELTTYGNGVLTTFGLDTTASTTFGGSLFSTYAPEETHSNSVVLTTSPTVQTTQTLLDGVVQTVKENPAAVATPFGLLAVGASAGYVFFKKRKEELADNGNSDTEEI